MRFAEKAIQRRNELLPIKFKLLIFTHSIIIILLKISGDNGVKIMFEALSCFDD